MRLQSGENLTELICRTGNKRNHACSLKNKRISPRPVFPRSNASCVPRVTPTVTFHVFLFSDTTLPCPRGSGARARRNTPHAWNTGPQSSCRFGISSTHKTLHVTLPVPWENEGHVCASTKVCDTRHVLLNTSIVAGTGSERKHSVLYQARIKMVPQVHFTQKRVYRIAHGRRDNDRGRTGLWSTLRREIF